MSDTENTAAVEETQTAEAAPVVTEEPAAEAEAAVETAEGAEAAEGEAEQAKPDEGGKHRRKGGYQRQIEKLQRERDLLLEQLGRNQPAQPAAPAQKLSPDEEAKQRTEAYFRSLVAEQVAAERAQEQQARAQQEFQQRMEATIERHPDFDDALQSVAHVPVPGHVQAALLTSEVGPEIMYSLATNPAELARISALPPVVAVREIGRLEAKLASSTAAPKNPAKPAVRKPTAPAPLSPVVARAASNAKRVEDMTYDEYCAWRKSQGGR